jgi:hypothetical protein
MARSLKTRLFILGVSLLLVAVTYAPMALAGDRRF